MKLRLHIKDDCLDLIEQRAEEGGIARRNFYELYSEDIQEAAKLLALAFSGERRLFLCGLGSCGSIASLLANRFIYHIVADRPALPAVALSASYQGLATDTELPAGTRVFSRQLEAFASDGDVLILFSLDGMAPALIEAANTAHEQGMFVMGITGGDGGTLAKDPELLDLELRVPSIEEGIILEVQISLTCLLSELTDYYLYTKPEILSEMLQKGVSDLRDELSGD